MAIAKITGEGLVCIAVLVTLLWGCILVENSMTRSSRRETARLLFDLRKLKNNGRVIPASHPADLLRFMRPAVG